MFLFDLIHSSIRKNPQQEIFLTLQESGVALTSCKFSDVKPFRSLVFYFAERMRNKDGKKRIIIRRSTTMEVTFRISSSSTRLDVSSTVDDVASRRGDVNGVKDWSEDLAKWSGDGTNGD